MFPPSRVLPALPGTPAPATVSSGQLWTPGANGMSTPMGAAGTSSGLQFPMKLGAGPMGAQTGAGLKSSAPSTPQPTRDGSADPEKDDKHPTDVDSLMDAVGISGVNIDAEEDALRIANEKLHQASVPSGPSVDRSRKQDFIDPNVLAECVKKIAAAFQLRTLEPDTIPFIALATRHRLAQLINAAIAARDHRIHSSHFRPPPISSSLKRKRDGSDEESEEGGEEDDEERRRRKGKGKEVGAGWDQVIHDDQEKILQVLEKVEREEERKKRRERMLRDEREREQRELEEEIRLSEAANAELGGNSGASALDKLVMGGNTASGSATPKEVELGKDGKPKKEKKKKKDGPGNLALDHAKKLTDQVAMRSIGGRSFTWATQGNSGFASPTPGGLNTPGSTLPRPKFGGTPSGLPPPNFGTPLSKAAFPALSTTFPNNSASFDPLSRLTNVPPLHDANRTEVQKAEWERNKKVVELGDVTFALERERGMGVGRGSGRNVLIRSRSGLRGGGQVWRGR